MQSIEGRRKSFSFSQKVEKKDAPGNLYKSTTENTPFFNRNELFIVRKDVPVDNTYYYWISKTGDSKLISNKFLRQELFAIKNQFDE